MNDHFAIAPDTQYELAALAKARRYQGWLREITFPHMGERILELGAGIGNMSQHLPERELLILAEVEKPYLEALHRLAGQKGRKHTEVVELNLEHSLTDLFVDRNLDTIVSFNVLEHIKDDVAVLADAIRLLRESKSKRTKRIVSLVPAHQWAYGTVDKELLHHRRYTRSSMGEKLRMADTTGAIVATEYRYINIPGLLAWFFANRILRKKTLGTDLIRGFEFLYPVIRPVDDLLHTVGRIPLGQSLMSVTTIRS